MRGECHIETASLSDPILARADGQVLYTFASVIDDADFGITHVLRGEDHVANTAVQIELFPRSVRASRPSRITISSPPPQARRCRSAPGALSLRSFRAEGVDPLAVAIVATLTGTSEAIRPLDGLDALADLLDLAKFSRALTKFDPARSMISRSNCCMPSLSPRCRSRSPRWEFQVPRLKRSGLPSTAMSAGWRKRANGGGC